MLKFISVFAFILSGCQSEPIESVLNGGYKRVDWYLHCPTDPRPIPAAAPDQLILVGEGPHQAYREDLVGAELTFHGRLCQGQVPPRDIVFLVDISSSMMTNDPRVNDTCGRKRAIEFVVNELGQDPDNQFAVISFDANVNHTSTQIFADETAMFGEMGADSADVLCATQAGTNYTNAMNAAKDMFANSSAHSAKEIFIVSDGQPDNRPLAISTAEEFKTTGIPIQGTDTPVMFATLMLQGIDSALNDIASKDASGNPLFARVDAADDLLRAMAGLSGVGIIGGELEFGTSGQPVTRIALMPISIGRDFRSIPKELDLNNDTQALQVELKYRDRSNQTFSATGQLSWLD